MTTAHEVTIRRYLQAMEVGNLPGVLACFTPDAMIASPVYGEGPVLPFYKALFADTVRTSIVIRELYRSDQRSDRWIAHFDYVWMRRDQPDMNTELIDLFELDRSSGRIMKLRIVIAGKAIP